jgi:hypothetical protein
LGGEESLGRCFWGFLENGNELIFYPIQISKIELIEIWTFLKDELKINAVF